MISDATKDIKDMVVAGCRVQLRFRAKEHGRWIVQGTVRCGIDDHAAEQSFCTASYPTREEAEQQRRLYLLYHLALDPAAAPRL